MKAFWQPWVDHLEQRTWRERLLFLLIACAAVVLLLDTLTMEPLRQENQQQTRSIESLQAEQLRLQTQFAELLQQSGQDPNRGLRERIQQRQDALAEFQQQVGEQMETWIPPARMNQVMQALVGTTPGLRLQTLRSIPLQALDLGHPAESQAPAVFRRPVEIEFTGSFHALLEYMDKLNALPWSLGWEHLQIDATDYPQVQFHLRLYTLSIDEEWLRV